VTDSENTITIEHEYLFIGPPGAQIYAPANGTVIHTDQGKEGYGKFIRLGDEHGTNLS